MSWLATIRFLANDFRLFLVLRIDRLGHHPHAMDETFLVPHLKSSDKNKAQATCEMGTAQRTSTSEDNMFQYGSFRKEHQFFKDRKKNVTYIYICDIYIHV